MENNTASRVAARCNKKDCQIHIPFRQGCKLQVYFEEDQNVLRYTNCPLYIFECSGKIDTMRVSPMAPESHGLTKDNIKHCTDLQFAHSGKPQELSSFMDRVEILNTECANPAVKQELSSLASPEQYMYNTRGGKKLKKPAFENVMKGSFSESVGTLKVVQCTKKKRRCFASKKWSEK